jgi:hypothetical protein
MIGSCPQAFKHLHRGLLTAMKRGALRCCVTAIHLFGLSLSQP